MKELELSNRIDCEELDTDNINFEVKNLIFYGLKKIYLRNVFGKKGLLYKLKGDVKIEIVGNAGTEFANEISGPRIVVDGDVGENSAFGVINGKFTVFGSCSRNFANEVQSGEFYILENIAENSFYRLQKSCKVVIGGQPGNNFANLISGGVVIVLNLKGGNIFIDDWFKNCTSGIIYLRGIKENIVASSKKFYVSATNENDEDIYLPLISEFARQFSYSLSEIKSVPFYKLRIR